MDPLLHTDMLCANLDSSVLFYDKAFKGITEKELRKNDEYYEGLFAQRFAYREICH